MGAAPNSRRRPLGRTIVAAGPTHSCTLRPLSWLRSSSRQALASRLSPPSPNRLYLRPSLPALLLFTWRYYGFSDPPHCHRQAQSRQLCPRGVPADGGARRRICIRPKCPLLGALADLRHAQVGARNLAAVAPRCRAAGRALRGPLLARAGPGPDGPDGFAGVACADGVPDLHRSRVAALPVVLSAPWLHEPGHPCQRHRGDCGEGPRGGPALPVCRCDGVGPAVFCRLHFFLVPDSDPIQGNGHRWRAARADRDVAQGARRPQRDGLP